MERKITVSNKNAKQFVENRLPFKGSNVFGEWTNKDTYKVFSYGYHFPLFVNKCGLWYENKEKYSVTTSKHFSQLKPDEQRLFRYSTNELKAL